MVTKWGLSEKLGPLTYNDEEGEPFLGNSSSKNKSISDNTTNIIDQEVRRIIDINADDKAIRQLMRLKIPDYVYIELSLT